MTRGKSSRLTWAACLFMLLVACTLQAQSPRTLRFETLGVEHGLAQETATTILQDRDGFMWFGSQAGLARYDGQRTVLFRAESGSLGALADNWVSVLFEDRHGRLWVGSRAALQWFDPVTQTFVTPEGWADAARSAGARHVQTIVADPAGGLWIGTGDGLHRVDEHGVPTAAFRHDPAVASSLPSNEVNALAWDRRARLWVGTGAGAVRMLGGEAGFERLETGNAQAAASAGDPVAALLTAADGRLWVGSPAGLQRWDFAEAQPRVRRFGSAEGFATSAVQALLEDDLGQVWIGTLAEGLLRWDAERERFIGFRHHIGDRQSLTDDNVSSLYQDRTGTLWVGTRTGGASHVDLASGGFERHARFDQASGVRDGNKIYAVWGDDAGALWLGSVGGGLHHLELATGEVRNYRHDPSDPHSLPHDRVGGIHRDARGRLWVSTDVGLAQFENGRFRLALAVADLGFAARSSRMLRIVSDRDGMLWIGSDGGLIRYHPDSGATRVLRNDPDDPRSLGYGRVLALHRDRRERLWVGTEEGLDLLAEDGESFVHVRPDPARGDALASGRIHSIGEDRRGRLWVGTANGLHRSDEPATLPLRFTRYTRAEGLDADPIGAVLEDAAGQIWISTTAGLSRLDPETGAVRNYSARDGLIDSSFYVGSAWAAADDALYFAGAAGVVEVRPASLRDNARPPQAVITELQLFNRPLQAGGLPDGVQLDLPVHRAGAISIPHDQSMLSIEFAALHFADPARNRYAYRMLGLDETWIESDATRRYVTYSGLAPGQYTFELKAANKDGVWSPEPTRLAVTVVPPWWATWWARSAFGLLAGLMLWGAYRMRVVGLTRQRAVLEAEVAARTAEVVQQKEAIEQAHQNLSVLGDIGREITASLDQDAIVATLDRHVHALLDATTFVIYRFDEQAAALVSVLDVEEGRPLPSETIALDDPVRHAACCARERRELLMDVAPGEDDPSQVPGTLHTLSALFAPLAIGARLLGVMTIQSPQRHAYGERERQIFRTLCAYGAIALDNAGTYLRLCETDQRFQQLVQEQQLILDNVAAAVFLVKDRTIQRCNRGMEDMLGYAPGELVGQSTAVYHPSHESWEEQGRKVYAQILAGQVAEGEWEVMRKDGAHIWIAFRGRAVDPMRPDDGSIWVAQDITARRRAEAELEQIRREQQIIFDNLSGGTMFTKDRIVVRCNRGTEEILGFASGTLEGQSSRVYFPSDEAFEAFGRWAYPTLIRGEVVQGEVTWQHTSGELIPGYVSGRALDPEDLAKGVVWMATDLRQQKKAAAELDRARRELQIIFDNAIGAISVMRKGRIERCSRGFVALFGYSEQDLEALPVEQLAADIEESRKQFKAQIPEIASGRVVHGEFHYRRKDGATGWLVYQGRALEPSDLDQGVIWLSQDITALKQQEHALRDSKAQVERSLAEVEQLNRQVSTIGELTGFLQASPSAEEAYSCIGEFGPRLFADSCGALYLLDAEHGDWVEHGRWGADASVAVERFASNECWALRRSRSYRVDAPSEALCCPHVREQRHLQLGEMRPYACLPLTAQGKTFGLLYIEFADLRHGDAAERRYGVAVAMAEQIALAIANVQLREALLQQSIRDPLTGLYNRRFLQEALFREIGRCKREGQPLALLMIDVDHFKRCNDQFGHPAGDQVLKQVARVLEQGQRAGHLACRFGGEEFSILLPNCELEGAQHVAERMLEGMRGLSLSHEGRALARVTVSIGVALYPLHGGNPESLIEAADGALYAAKQGGRDRLMVSAKD